MGGAAPEKLIDMINRGITLTSLDYMLTKGCNFSCLWCFANSGPLEREFLPFRILKSITEEAAELGVTLFILTGGEPLVYTGGQLGRQHKVGDHLFKIVEMIRETYSERGKTPKILTFDDVALITPEIARQFADHEVGLCTKGDALIPELQDYKVNQKGAFRRMQRGYQNLIEAGYGRDAKLRLFVNSVLDQTTFDGMLDLHMRVVENGFDHSIVPVHYCGTAEYEDQEAGIHSHHVKVLYDLISRINKTCNRNRSGLHIRANGDV